MTVFCTIDTPKSIDYTIRYHHIKTKEEIDDYKRQINENIIHYNTYKGLLETIQEE